MRAILLFLCLVDYRLYGRPGRCRHCSKFSPYVACYPPPVASSSSLSFDIANNEVAFSVNPTWTTFSEHDVNQLLDLGVLDLGSGTYFDWI